MSIDISAAYKITAAEAKKWNKDAKIYYASSTDCDYSDLNQGSDGTRRAWTFVFVIENPDTCFNVFVKDGKIDHTQEVISAFNKDLVLPEGELNVSSKDAVVIAQSKGLKPGDNWAIGYHFALQNIDNELSLIVTGENENNEMTKINVNDLTKLQDLSPSSITEVSAQQSPMAAANVQQYVFDQNATAYCAAPGKKGSSGVTMAVGMVAVHPKVYSANTATAVNSGPVIPYGTLLTWYSTSASVTINGQSYRQFTVQDIGQTNNQQNYSRWWVDIYFGTNTVANVNAANAFGNKHTYSYSYWAPLDL